MLQSNGQTSAPLVGLFTLAIFYTLYVVREFLLPVILALVLCFLLRPVVRLLRKAYIPHSVGALLVVVAMVATTLVGIGSLYKPATEWMGKAPQILRTFKRNMVPVRKSLEDVKETAKELEKITTSEKPEVSKVQVQGTSLAEMVLSGTRTTMAAAAVMLILLYFLLAYGDLFIGKIVNLFSRPDTKQEILLVAQKLEYQVSRYLFTVTVINAFLGVAIGVAMYLVGMPNPILWGVAAALANYIPYLGAIVGAAIVGVVAFLSFDSLSHALLAPLSYMTLTVIEGQFITPTILGLRFSLNPVVFYVWLIFWGWMWGVVGAILAVPLLTIFKIFCDHVPFLSPVGAFLEK